MMKTFQQHQLLQRDIPQFTMMQQLSRRDIPTTIMRMLVQKVTALSPNKKWSPDMEESALDRNDYLTRKS